MLGLRPLALALPFVLAAPVAAALPATPLSAGVAPPGHVEVAGLAGFPFLEVDLARGLLPGVEAGLVARSAWGNMQRFGAEAKLRIFDEGGTAAALRLAADGWLAEPRSGWLSVTGEEDYGAGLDLLYSWATEAGHVLTLDAGWRVVATKRPPSDPLSGASTGLGVGSNLSAVADVEIPLASGLVLAFQAGVAFHLSGFDGAVVMPLVAAGVGKAL